MEERELPVGWELIRLSEAAEWGSGGTPSRRNLDFYGGKIPWIKTGELGPRYIMHTKETISDLGLANSSAKIFPEGSIAIAMYGATIGKVSILGVPAATNQACAVAAVYPGVCSSEYFFHYLCSQRDEFVKAGKGGAQPNISQGLIKDWPIPLAPLNEQRRIAAKLDTTLAAVEACRQRLDGVAAILKRFRQAVLAAATSGELTREWREERGIEMDWTPCRLAEIAEIQGGITKDSKKQIEEYPELPYLRVANVQRGYLDLSEVALIKVPPSRLDVLLLKAGDVLFNEGGDRDKVGRGWIWEGQIRECVFQNHVFRARLYNSEDEPKFVSWWSNTCGTDHFLKLGKQTTNLASISKSTLGSLPINLPPPTEQKEIVRRVEDLSNYADQLEAKLTAASRFADRLIPALLAKAFRGELLPQDPNDVPASELLAKLKSTQSDALHLSPRRRAKQPTQRQTMSISDKDSVKAAILNLNTDRFSFDELRDQAGGDYDSLKGILFKLLEEPSPVVRQVFDQEAKAMKLERIRQ